MKPAGASVVLTMTWDGPLPTPGEDALRTPSGRRYRVDWMRGKRWGCTVLGPEAVVAGTTFPMYWNPRSKKRSRAPIL